MHMYLNIHPCTYLPTCLPACMHTSAYAYGQLVVRNYMHLMKTSSPRHTIRTQARAYMRHSSPVT